jgi:hypothetical protein
VLTFTFTENFSVPDLSPVAARFDALISSYSQRMLGLAMDTVEDEAQA